MSRRITADNFPVRLVVATGSLPDPEAKSDRARALETAIEALLQIGRTTSRLKSEEKA